MERPGQVEVLWHDYAYISFLGSSVSYFFKVSLDYNEKITIRQVRKGCSYPYIMTRILEKMSLLWAILALDFGLFDFNSVTTYVGLL